MDMQAGPTPATAAGSTAAYRYTKQPWNTNHGH